MKIIVNREEEKQAVNNLLVEVCEWELWDNAHGDTEIQFEFADEVEIEVEE